MITPRSSTPNIGSGSLLRPPAPLTMAPADKVVNTPRSYAESLSKAKLTGWRTATSIDW
jgi:hypothetical protein